ncbi:LysE family translocator [Roseicitreum antarcticum]|uniref:Threonine/homoserine/homoserine lactone efflux protein n=1 Tax=Roseicitreum antarcticum TaxID=564137 RepID=A0A1H3EIX1_9RHOB|nr:LysE family translocator [Roseicitreum antarcticum]SDX77869.1 Threonine/homoserine/homoserine lactone efflux protein [Roseicitreum antarcticum]
MEPVALFLFAFALLINAGTPGPSIAALVSRVISNGWRDIAPFVAAMWLGEVIWLTVAVAGLSALAETFHIAFLMLKYCGVAYLAYLAWKMWHEPVTTEEETLPEGRSGWSMFAAGMALTLGNPKIMVFYLALLPTLIDLSNASMSLWAVVASVTVIVLAGIDIAWVALAHHARKMLKTPRAIKIANRVGATSLGGAAIVIASR